MKREPQHPIAQAVHSLIKATCTKPETLDIIESFKDSRLEMVFLPDMCDLRILIGAKGKTITALKHVTHQMARRGWTPAMSADMELRESYIGDVLPARDFAFNPNFKGLELTPILLPFLRLLFNPVPHIRFEDNGEKLYVIIDAPAGDLTLIKAMGVAFYPYGVRHGRKLSFRIVDYHENENETNRHTTSVPPPLA